MHESSIIQPLTKVLIPVLPSHHVDPGLGTDALDGVLQRFEGRRLAVTILAIISVDTVNIHGVLDHGGTQDLLRTELIV